MKRILHLISSPRQEASVSIKLGRVIVERLLQKYPDGEVNEVNLLELNLPHLDAQHLNSLSTPEDKLKPQDRKLIMQSDIAIGQLIAADIIVLGAPMYNFSVHSSLKAWIDHVARSGKTFRYTEKGVEGLVSGKKVFIAMASGGVYSGGQFETNDFVVPYLKSVLGFLGMTDITVYRAEGVNIPGLQETALKKAFEEVNLMQL